MTVRTSFQRAKVYEGLKDKGACKLELRRQIEEVANKLVSKE